tara:strand:- start:446 stop:574 length:129 start_codon:yes stop_codon:yes gene_type:complete
MKFLDKIQTLSTKAILFVIAPILVFSVGVIGVLFILELLGVL